jgi:mRNA interferase MazF
MVKQGDIIKLDFDPQIGHEQAGYRPAVILSNDFSIKRHSVAYACPITNTTKPYPTHIPLDKRTKTTGVVICEQCKALDLVNRDFKYIETIPDDILIQVINTIKAIIDVPHVVK